MNFASPQDLGIWLESRGVDCSQWGQDRAKELTDLWYELINQDIKLADEPVLRVVQAVTVVIRRDDKVLIETEQVFKDGRRRLRNQPPSEKMKLGESYHDAAIRCLEEELGLVREQVKMISNTHQSTHIRRDAFSYPGLATHYHLHRVEAQVNDLPPRNFCTTESSSTGTNDPIKHHYWSWQKVSDEVIG